LGQKNESLNATANNELLPKLQKAIREEGLDGWLFCNFRHRDKLSDAILERSAGLSNSRFWFYAVPGFGEPRTLVHAIEADHLDGLPGIKQSYVSRADLANLLAPLGGKRWGVHVSPEISAVSYLDAGTYAFLCGAGLELVSAERLIQRFKGVLDKEGIASHERAAEELYGIVNTVWDFVSSSYHKGATIYEGDLRNIMEGEFIRRNLCRDHPPLVAAGIHSSNPHYDFSGQGAAIKEGDIIQLDLWAKEQGEAAVYADISWVGVYGKKAEPAALQVFANLAEIREKTFRFIETAMEEDLATAGAAVDRYCRSLLRDAGYEKAIKHRTGHGIDTEVHGSGVNMDSVEFPDTRPLLEGSCFSLEPGIYLDEYGFRTEINVYISQGSAQISGPAKDKQGRQFTLLTCQEKS
jgi:Xaa-Pro aminopeptidase